MDNNGAYVQFIFIGTIIVLILQANGCIRVSQPDTEPSKEVYNLGLNDFNVLEPSKSNTIGTLIDFFSINPNNYLVLTDDDDIRPGLANKADQAEEQKIFDKLSILDEYLREAHDRDGVDNRGSPIRVVLESGGGPIGSGAFWLGREQPDFDMLDPITELLQSMGADVFPPGHIFLDHRRPPYTPVDKPGTEYYNHYDFMAPGDSLEILAHELGHGIAVNENKYSFLPCFEAGAAFESFADVFGVVVGDDWILGNDHLVDRQASAYSRNLSDPHLSRGPCSIYFTGDRSTNTCAVMFEGGPVTMDNSLHQPKHTKEYKPSYGCQLSVHANGGILNYAAYLISQGGEYVQDGQTIIFPGIDQPSIDGNINRSELEKLYYYTITSQHLQKNVDFQGVRTAVIASASDLYKGSQSWKVDTVRHAFEAVGISEEIPEILAEGIQLSATAKASSNSEYSLATYVVDGNPNTYWQPPAGKVSWILLDLGQAQMLHQTRVVWRVDANLVLADSYDLQVSMDGTTWTKVLTGNTTMNVYGGILTRIESLSGYTARYVRLSNIVPVNSSTGAVNIQEFEVYSPPTGLLVN